MPSANGSTATIYLIDDIQANIITRKNLNWNQMTEHNGWLATMKWMKTEKKKKYSRVLSPARVFHDGEREKN